MEKNKLYKNITKIAGSTLISRILGYLRDMAIAHYFGAGAIADAFYVSYRIPNLLRRLLGEGALVSSFVPVYTDYIAHKTKEEQEKFLGTIYFVLTSLLVVLTILGIIFTPFILTIIAPGFKASPDKLKLAILLTRIMFPFFITIGLAAFFMGILYVHHIFVYSALSSCFLSISELFFMFCVCPFMSAPIVGLSIGVVLGGLSQGLFQMIPIIKQKIKVKFCFDFKNEGFRKVCLLMLPATIGVSVDQISAFVDIIFASWLREGSVSALYYSNHLMLLPLSLFGVAVSSVSLPVLSKSASFENYDVMKNQLRENINIMSFFILPSTIGLIILAKPIIKLLFERGKFDAAASQMSSSALKFYCVGLIAYALVKILSTAFYSLKDTKTPVKIAAICVMSNVILNAVLMQFLEVGGLALATSLSSFLNASLLAYKLRGKIGNLGFMQTLNNFLKILASSMIMGIILFFIPKLHHFNKLFSVFIPLVSGVLTYFIFCYIFRVKEVVLFTNFLRAKLARKD